MKGQLYLTGEVDDRMLRDLWQQIAAAKDEITSFDILLSSDGGDVCAAFGIYDTIKYLAKGDCTVDIIASGACMSAASMIILQAGTKRFATPNAQIMLHYGVEENESPSDVKQSKKLTKLVTEILVKRCKVPRRTVSLWLAKNTYFSAKEALAKGLIDGIIGGEDE